MVVDNMYILLRNPFIATLLCFIIRHFINSTMNKNSGTNKLPPGPKGFPILGSLPHLGNKPHIILAKMSKTYGPVMLIKMGTSNMIVASSSETARQIHTILDQNFANRPSTTGVTHLEATMRRAWKVIAKYKGAMKMMRRISNHHMLSAKAVAEWSDVRKTESGNMIRAMYDASARGEPVVVAVMLANALGNMIGQLVISKRVFDSTDKMLYEFKEMIVELVTKAGYFCIGDFMPWLAWMGLQGIESWIEKTDKIELDSLMTNLLEEHGKTRNQRKENPDFFDAIMETSYKDDDGDHRLSMTALKGMLRDQLSTGGDTSSTTIEWGLSEVLKNPNILKRVQNEMDEVIGRNRRLEESDIPNLPYLRAICKETFRRHPSIPLNLPRISEEECYINGYYIPKNTRLMVNLWAITHDPDVWDNPYDFNPERFLTGKYANIDPRGNDFELIPFGAGRRSCPGSRMAMVLVEYILGSFIHSFDWKLPNEVAQLNMDEAIGLAMQRAIPLSAKVTPRLDATAYAV